LRLLLRGAGGKNERIKLKSGENDASERETRLGRQRLHW
jgi:hypothetical protein